MISHRVWLDSYHREYVDVQGDVDSVSEAVDLLLERWGPYNPTVTEGPPNNSLAFDLSKMSTDIEPGCKDLTLLYKRAQIATMSASAAVIDYLQELIHQNPPKDDPR